MQYIRVLKSSFLITFFVYFNANKVIDKKIFHDGSTTRRKNSSQNPNPMVRFWSTFEHFVCGSHFHESLFWELFFLCVWSSWKELSNKIFSVKKVHNVFF
uniref:(northern house mosquito) hypothetical protein n=1 Tax=Culex pipiens TaxID=7175 RepID=A0A8D8D7V2_CULPI